MEENSSYSVYVPERVLSDGCKPTGGPKVYVSVRCLILFISTVVIV